MGELFIYEYHLLWVYLFIFIIVLIKIIEMRMSWLKQFGFIFVVLFDVLEALLTIDSLKTVWLVIVW